MTKEEIINLVSQELNLSKDIVGNTYDAYWLSIKSIIQQLPLKDDLTEEQFNSIKTSINIPSLGKLACTYRKYIGAKKRLTYIKKI